MPKHITPSEIGSSALETVFGHAPLLEGGFNPAFFSNKDLAKLSQTSKAMNKVVSGELNQHAAQKLLTHVVLGQQDKAEAMIKANPKLLSIKTSAIDYSGRTIIATAFQAAIGAGDTPMWEMILKYLEKDEELKQFNEQFPNGIEDDVSAEDLKPYYNGIASAIINNEDNGTLAIEAFRKEITAKKEITQGKHFNFGHLVAAYQAYIYNFDALENWPNRAKFWQKVIGYVQRQMSAYDAQVLCSGIRNVLDDKSRFSRTLSFVNGGEFFPLSPLSGLGFDCAARVCWRRARGGYWVGGCGRAAAALPARDGWHFIEKLYKTKTDELAGLTKSLEQGMRYQSW